MTIDQLLRDNRTTMMAYAKRLTRHHETAEDLVQTASLYACRSKTKPDDVDNPKAFMNGCVRMAYLRWRRNTQQFVVEPVIEDVADGEQPFALELKAISAVVETLPPEQQNVFRMVRLEGRSTRESAKLLGYKDHRSVTYHLAKAMETITRLAA